MEVEPIHVLLVEDDPGDVKLMERSLERSKLRLSLNVVSDGEQALNFLYKKGTFSDAVRPDVILLDLNLPGVDGREVLQTVKKDESLRRIPVVVLTTSESEKDIAGSYHEGANCYITKPVDFDKFTEVVETIDKFWFVVVKLPEDV